MLRINKIPIGNLKQSEIVKFIDKEWYVIGTDGKEEVSLLAKDSWEYMKFGKNNNYCESKAREYLSLFITEKMITQILFCDEKEIKEKLFLLSYNEAECLPRNIKKYDYDWWLRSPCRDTSIAVWLIAAEGSCLYYSLASYTRGIRPACVVNVQALKEATNE